MSIVTPGKAIREGLGVYKKHFPLHEDYKTSISTVANICQLTNNRRNKQI